MFKALTNKLQSNLVLNANNMLTGNKVSMLVSSVFLTLPSTVEFIKKDMDEEKSIFQGMENYIDFTTKEIVFKFYYAKNSDLNRIEREFEKNPNLLSFLYISRLQEITLGLNKSSNMDYCELKLSENKKWLSLSREDKNTVMTAANKYFSNAFTVELVDTVNGLEYVFYETLFEGLMNYEIAKKILDNNSREDIQSKIINDTDTSLNKTGEEEERLEELDQIIDAMATNINNRMKGNVKSDIEEKLKEAIPVEMDWAKKLDLSLRYRIYNESKRSETSWAGFNNKYLRRGIRLPKKNYYEKSNNMIVAIDHSGSMSDIELQKMLFIIESMGKNINNIYVIIHDVEIKKFIHIKDFNKKVKAELFQEAFKTRWSKGGTSHKDVFLKISALIQSTRKANFTTLIFSDMYSDIPVEYAKHKRVLDRHKYYFLCTEKQSSGMRTTNCKDIFIKGK